MNEPRTASDERPDWIWHDIEQLLRNNHNVDDDTFKGSAKEIYNLFLAKGWTYKQGSI